MVFKDSGSTICSIGPAATHYHRYTEDNGHFDLPCKAKMQYSRLIFVKLMVNVFAIIILVSMTFEECSLQLKEEDFY